MEGAHVRDVQVTVNSKPVSVPMQTTGSAIKSRAGVNPNWQLFRIQGDHEVEVGDDEPVHATPNEKFIATPVLEPA